MNQQSPQPCVSVVILSMNKTQDILACIESVKKQTYRNMNIVVVDNGSTDGTPHAIAESHPDVHVIRNDKNLGICTGRNQGWSYAKKHFFPEYILQLDNDTVLAPGYVEHLYEAMRGDPSVGLVCGKAYARYPSTTLASAGIRVNLWTGIIKDRGHGDQDRGQFNVPEYVDAAPGFGNLIRIGALEAAEGWNEAYDPYGWDDTEFCLRLRKLAFRIAYVPKAIIYHSGTQFGRAPMPVYERSKVRNYFRVVSDYASLPQKFTTYALLPFRWVLLAGRHVRNGNGYVLKAHAAAVYDWIRGDRRTT